MDSEDLHYCECGQTISNRAGTIATYRNSERHERQMSNKRQTNNMMNYFKCKTVKKPIQNVASANEAELSNNSDKEQLIRSKKC